MKLVVLGEEFLQKYRNAVLLNCDQIILFSSLFNVTDEKEEGKFKINQI